MYKGSSRRSGFTLIELLVVIAIVAILSVVVILTLNPAELLKQARDSNRISELQTLKTALSLYLVDVRNINLASTSLSYSACYLSTTQGNGTTTAACGELFQSAYIITNGSTTATAYRHVDATGWLPVDFTQLSSGSPLGGALPIDPRNNATFYFAYAASSSGIFEINALMESFRYGAGGPADVESNARDGGDNPQAFETGNDPGLNL